MVLAGEEPLILARRPGQTLAEDDGLPYPGKGHEEVLNSGVPLFLKDLGFMAGNNFRDVMFHNLVN
jgi:hypothetical protein